MQLPVLYIVVPCYNEEEVLPITSKMFTDKLAYLTDKGKISEKSRVMFINDGSRDSTWDIITRLSEADERCIGIALSRNRGHQNALLAGLMEAKEMCDVTISIDCDGQDDINAMDEMIERYHEGCDIVYGVRTSRKTDTLFKRSTAQTFYKILTSLGVETVYNHADYRLMSSRVLREFADFKEVNLYLRGMVPLIGFKSATVGYDRTERLAGKGHYPLRKMISLAFQGITSLSIKPIRMILDLGIFTAVAAFISLVVSSILFFCGVISSGLIPAASIICLLLGVQIAATGLVGEYVGKVYMETKARPRYIISEKTYK